MAMADLVTALLCRVDDARTDVPDQSPQALSPGARVTIGLRHALKGVRSRYCSHGRRTHDRDLCPQLPRRTRLLRRLRTRRAWTERFRAAPSLLGVLDRGGIALRHPVREGRRRRPRGQTGLSHPRGIGGGQRCVVLDPLGQIGAWDCDSAHVHDTPCAHRMEPWEGQRIVLGDRGFHPAGGDRPHVTLCRRGAWHERMGVETVLSMLTVRCRLTQMRQRVWAYFEAKRAYLMAAFNLRVQGHGLEPDAHGRGRLSLAQFTL